VNRTKNKGRISRQQGQGGEAREEHGRVAPHAGQRRHAAQGRGRHGQQEPGGQEDELSPRQAQAPGREREDAEEGEGG